MADTTVLTGATGFLGMELLAQLAQRDERPIIALVRAADREQADERIAAVRKAVFGDERIHADRITAVRADLQAPHLGLGQLERKALARQAREVVHSAASVAFNSPLSEARATNVDGARRVMELARLAADEGALRRMVHVSTAYVAGDRDGVCLAEELDALGPHRNTYERSKAEAEELLRNRGRELPLTVVRPSIVVGHSQTGWTSAFNVVYGPLRAFAAGALRVIPGRADAPVDVVPVDFVARAITALLDSHAHEGRTVHLTAGAAATTVGELCELGARHFGQREPLILPPRLYRRAVHPVMVATGPPRRRKALRAGEVYLPYFAARCRYDARASHAELQRLGVPTPPPLSGYFASLMAYAETARWGKNHLSRAQLSAGATQHTRVIAAA